MNVLFHHIRTELRATNNNTHSRLSIVYSASCGRLLRDVGGLHVIPASYLPSRNFPVNAPRTSLIPRLSPHPCTTNAHAS